TIGVSSRPACRVTASASRWCAVPLPLMAVTSARRTAKRVGRSLSCAYRPPFARPPATLRPSRRQEINRASAWLGGEAAEDAPGCLHRRFDDSLVVRRGEETGLILGRRQVHASIQHAPEVAGETLCIRQ